MVTSGLIADAVVNVSGLPTPLPKSPTAATRSNGVGGSSSTTGHLSRIHAVAGPATPNPPATSRISFANQYPT